MAASLILSAVLIALAPGYALFGSEVATGLLSVLIVAALVMMDVSPRAEGPRKLGRLLRPALLVVVLAPLAWMLLQAVPLPFEWFADPVWASTSSVLNVPIRGSMSIDTGETLISAVRYCALLATAIITAALTSDRQAASRLFHLLTAIAGVVAALQLGHLRFKSPAASEVGADLIAAQGMILSCALFLRAGQALSLNRRKLASLDWAALASAAMAILVLSVCAYLISDDMLLFAGLFGTGVLLSLYFVRRWSLGLWGKLGIFAVASLGVLGFLALAPAKLGADPALALSQVSSPTVEAMLSDVPLFGRGAGSAEHILPVDDSLHEQSPRRAVTAAAVMTFEMGRTFFWLFVFALVSGSAMLMQASLRRRRDHIYAAAGASVLLAVGISAFFNSDVLSLPASFLACATLGLALAQAQSSNDNADPASRPSQRAEPSPGIKWSYALCRFCFAAAAFWILIPELYAAAGSRMGNADAAASASQSDLLGKAASLAVVRGDLWARSALASAALLEAHPAAPSNDGPVRDRLVRALVAAPYQGRIWLTLARLASQFKWEGYDMTSLLKMAYYTGGEDIDSVTSRTKLALGLDSSHLDAELSEMVTADVNLVLRRRPEIRPWLIDAYKSASPQGRAVIRRSAVWADPSFRLQLGGR